MVCIHCAEVMRGIAHSRLMILLTMTLDSTAVMRGTAVVIYFAFDNRGNTSHNVQNKLRPKKFIVKTKIGRRRKIFRKILLSMGAHSKL